MLNNLRLVLILFCFSAFLTIPAAGVDAKTDQDSTVDKILAKCTEGHRAMSRRPVHGRSRNCPAGKNLFEGHAGLTLATLVDKD